MQSRRTRSNRNKARADPTAIATMAAVDSFLDFLWPGITGGVSGDGAGAGKNGLHAVSGLPQRFKFPVNAESGNLDRDAGIEPLSLLLETLKLLRLPAEMLGRLPENPLFSRKSPVKWVKLVTVNGIGPVKLLVLRSSRVNRTNRVNPGGNSPEN